MALDQIPPLFEILPATLFGPLAGGHASLYWAILARFYQYEFEREPFFLVKPVAIDVTCELVRTSKIWAERRDELLSLEDPEHVPTAAQDEETLLRATGRRLIARLEAAGWYHFEYRSAIGHVLNFYPYAARILETLVRVARDEQPVFQGYAHSIASLLKPDSFAARPGVSLLEAKRHSLELVRELKILNRNIYAFTQRLLDQVSTAAGVLEEGLDHYRQSVQANYHRLKTIDNLFKWRGEILHRLDVIERDALSLEAATRWYGEQLGVSADLAARQVADDVHILRRQFETLPDITDDIDTRNARFSGVALRKLMYLLRQDKRTEGQLQLIVDRLSHDRSPDIELDVYRCELLSNDFLYTPPRRRPRVRPQPIVRSPKPNGDQIRLQLAPRLRRRFARARLEELVNAVLGARGRASMAEVPVADDQEFVRLIYLVAFGLDGSSSYSFAADVAGTREQKDGYGWPAGTISRARRRR